MPHQEGDRPLTISDFEDRFSIDKRGKLRFNGAVVETDVGLKRRDFILAVTVAVIASLNMIASWVNAMKPKSAPMQLTCPAPVINLPSAPPPPAPLSGAKSTAVVKAPKPAKTP